LVVATIWVADAAIVADEAGGLPGSIFPEGIDVDIHHVGARVAVNPPELSMIAAG